MRLFEVQRKPICLSGLVSFNEETLKLLYVPIGKKQNRMDRKDKQEVNTAQFMMLITS